MNTYQVMSLLVLVHKVPILTQLLSSLYGSDIRVTDTMTTYGSAKLLYSCTILYAIVAGILHGSRTVSCIVSSQSNIYVAFTRQRCYQTAQGISGSIAQGIRLGMNMNYIIDILTARIRRQEDESLNSTLSGIIFSITAKMKGTTSSKVLTGLNTLKIGSLTARTIDYGHVVSITSLGTVGLKVAIMI